jgi:hypothetical protein
MLPLFEELKIWYFILPWVGVNKTTGCTKGVRRNVTSSCALTSQEGENISILFIPEKWKINKS